MSDELKELTARNEGQAIYSLDELAQIVKRSKVCVRRWAERGYVETIRIGTRIFVPAAEVARLRGEKGKEEAGLAS
jgi:hypothetical protein